MRAVTLWQPWASLVAVGAKRFETRGWPPPAALIGQRLAIHAAQRAVRSPRGADALDAACRRHLGDDYRTSVPRGAVVCTVEVVGAYRTGLWHADGTGARVVEAVAGSPMLTEVPIDPLGDFAPGRWVWWLADVRRVEPPAPAYGYQSLWRWNEASVERPAASVETRASA